MGQDAHKGIRRFAAGRKSTSNFLFRHSQGKTTRNQTKLKRG
jgi:hypothetical protein